RIAASCPPLVKSRLPYLGSLSVHSRLGVLNPHVGLGVESETVVPRLRPIRPRIAREGLARVGPKNGVRLTRNPRNLHYLVSNTPTPQNKRLARVVRAFENSTRNCRASHLIVVVHIHLEIRLSATGGDKVGVSRRKVGFFRLNLRHEGLRPCCHIFSRPTGHLPYDCGVRCGLLGCVSCNWCQNHTGNRAE